MRYDGISPAKYIQLYCAKSNCSSATSGRPGSTMASSPRGSRGTPGAHRASDPGRLRGALPRNCRLVSADRLQHDRVGVRTSQRFAARRRADPGDAGAGGGSAVGGPPAPVMQELTELRARLARNPKDLAALVQLANMEYDAQKFDKAAALYVRALALDPTNPDVRTDYATTLHRGGRDLDALKQLDLVLHQRPDFHAALFNRGVVLRAIGRRTDAIADFKKYLTVAGPDDPRVAEARTALQELGS